MRFDREPWVKLYKTESTAHRLMSLEARCLRDFLLRHCDEKGLLLEKSDNVPRDLCKAISADSSDAKKVAKWLKELEGVGYVVVGPEGRVELPKFEEAQSARTKNAERQARFKERRRLGVSDDEEEGVTGNAYGNGESALPETLQRDEMRRDEMRRDPPKPPEGADGGDTASRLIPCPADLALPAHVLEELAAFFGCSIETVKAEQREFVGYWTIGGGIGRTFSRANWLRKCRERIRQRLSEGAPARPTGPAQHDGPGPADPAKVERNRRALEAHERKVREELERAGAAS